MKKTGQALFATLSALCFFVFFVVNVSAAPEPTELFYVNDYAGELSDDTIQYILDSGDDLYARTGAQIVVSIIDSTGGISMEEYAVDMFNSWGIGSQKNNGLLLLISIGDEQYYILPGNDLQIKLPVNEVIKIADESLLPYLNEWDIDGGVRSAYEIFAERINRLYSGSQSRSVPAAEVRLDSKYSLEAAANPDGMRSDNGSRGFGFIGYIISFFVLLIRNII